MCCWQEWVVKMAKGIIFDVKEFTVQDGPGIRTTVFLKGCPLRCKWCHNPEGMDSRRQLMVTGNGCTHCGKCQVKCQHKECAGLGRCIKACPNGLVKAVGKEVNAEELAGELRVQSDFFENSGVTISGGEPTMQPLFLLDLLQHLEGIHTIVETCGYVSSSVFEKVVYSCSMVYLDIKHMDGKRHKELTGVDNRVIQENLDFLIHSGEEFVVRIPLIPGYNDEEENMAALAQKLKGAGNIQYVEFLPYNTFTGAKYVMAGMEYGLKELDKKKHSYHLPEQIFSAYGIPFKAYM